MPPAARVGDTFGHGAPTGTVGPPGAGAAGAAAAAATPPGAPPIPQGAPIRGISNVLIGKLPAAVVGTVCTCAVPPPHALLGPANVIVPGPPPPRGVVLIGGFPAARVGDKGSCGGMIVSGAFNVLIGG